MSDERNPKKPSDLHCHGNAILHLCFILLCFSKINIDHVHGNVIKMTELTIFILTSFNYVIHKIQGHFEKFPNIIKFLQLNLILKYFNLLQSFLDIDYFIIYEIIFKY